ncbi:hypothetical protein GCWU000325_01175 [Alloprevotella tannerae ATCC 51259]|uniref:Uncharacterized protein n=1 Tax=Alloprevotella tannerae ATCC 51259 TaxID=626522 RepID=C9LG34_9BACT|nr:hypothetical protein GCWU000325_01175 [Alloprevotella tannerae ATCC 51259]
MILKNLIVKKTQRRRYLHTSQNLSASVYATKIAEICYINKQKIQHLFLRIVLSS